jgi:cobalt/nickel transport system permease protein
MDVAMHISNGIIDGPVSMAYGVVAAVLLALCLVKSREDLADRLAPMAGLVAAFIFAVQMLNFPVLPGVSGHLLGGALAAALVGPWVGALCVSVVLIIQALVFADGGIAALGLNIGNMALLGTAVGYLVLVGLLKLLPRTAAGLGFAVFLASIISVVIASQGFVLQFFLGGAENLTIGYGQISATMAGVHALIGVGEGLIAAVTVTTVAKVRPDLVYALQGRRLDAPAEGRLGTRGFVVAGLLVAFVLAGGVSYLASSAPDGLNATTLEGCTVNARGEITGGTCVAQSALNHEWGGSFLAHYGISGVGNSTGLAGVIGVVLTFAVGALIFWIIRRRRVEHGWPDHSTAERTHFETTV